MKKYYYKIVEFENNIEYEELEKSLNTLGEEGWKLVMSPTIGLALGHIAYIFVRQKEK